VKDSYVWGAHSAHRARSIWQGNFGAGLLPSAFEFPTTQKITKEIKRSIENSLVSRAYEIACRYTSNVAKEIDLHQRFPNSRFGPELGDYDVLVYLVSVGVVLSIECKDNNPPFSAKDSIRLRRNIFEGKDQHISKILRRENNLRDHTGEIMELMKWGKDLHRLPRVISLYVSRHTYWWFKYPPYEVDIEFVRIDQLDKYIRTLN
jgi:hypothetical protein